MSPRFLSSALALAALVACKNSGPADPEPGPPKANMLAAFDPARLADHPGAPPQPDAGAALAVTDYGPQGRTAGGAALKVRFNRAVVGLGEEEIPADAQYITLDPPIAGRTYFKTPELLVFEAEEPFAAATRYRVRFAGGLVAVDGQRLEEGLEWEFETPRPRCVGAAPITNGGDSEHALRRDTHYVLEFDQPTTLAEARAHITASARPLARSQAKAAPVAVRVSVATAKEAERAYWGYDSDSDRGRYYTVRAGSGLWPAASQITLSATPGLKGELGPLPLDTPWSMAFDTYSPQAIEAFGCGGETRCGLEAIGITLRNPVRAREARKITVSPRPKNLHVEISDAYDESGGTEVEIDGQFLPGTTYTVTIQPGLRDIYGQTLGSAFGRTVVIERRPALTLSSTEGTLIPGRKQTIGIEARFVRSLQVRVAVVPEVALLDKGWKAVAMPANALERTVALEPKGPGGWASIALDVADLIGGARGPVLVEVTASSLADNAEGEVRTARGLYRLTDLGPLVITSQAQSVVQVLRLSDSTPVVGATIARLVRSPSGVLTRALGVTDGDGVLILPPVSEYMSRGIVKQGEEEQSQTLLVVDAKTGDSTTLTAGTVPDVERLSAPLRPGERVIARIVADRGAYRPGESIKVVGWAAIDSPHVASGLRKPAKKTEVKLSLLDPTGAEVAARTVRTTAEGKFWAVLPIAEAARLGSYQIQAQLAGAEETTRVQVEDYRVPEFQVGASVAKDDILASEQATVRVTASYYFGGAVPISDVSLRTICSPHRYRPPGLEGAWAVGEPLVSKRFGGYSPRISLGADPKAKPGLREAAVTPTLPAQGFPHRCTISVEARDASFQAVGAETAVQVHPVSYYLAIGLPDRNRRAGDRVKVPLRALEIAGKRVAAKGAKLVVERRWQEVKERAEGGRMVFDGYVERTEKIKRCTLDVAATGEDAGCELPPLKEGWYSLRAEVGADAEQVRAAGEFRVASAKQTRWAPAPARERLSVQTSANEVSPGTPIEVVVQAPWHGGRGLLVLDRQGIHDVKPLVLTATAPPPAPEPVTRVTGSRPAIQERAMASFRYTADDTWTPQMHVRAFMVAPITAGSRSVRPQVQVADARIEQGIEHRRLQVRVEAPDKAGPRDRVELAAFVRDEAGAPVAARVALWAVDEAVLALTDYAVPDLLPSFMPSRDMGTHEYDDYGQVLRPYTPSAQDPWLTGGWGYGRGFGSGHGGRGASSRQAKAMVAGGPPPARSRFETTPIFLADLAADASGVARTRAELPDNLTTFRIFAVASARLVDDRSPGRFGIGDARTTVSTPFIVRAATPRQLRPGDEAEVAAIVQNFTAEDGRATVELMMHDAAGAKGHGLVAMSKKTASVEVPAGGQARVPFQIRAEEVGAAQLELRATLRKGPAQVGRDAIKVALPVEPERTLTEKVAMYGSLADDQAVAIPVVLPGAVRHDVGGVSVSASSSLLGGLEDAVEALVTYPHGCVEQTASKLLPVVALAALHPTYPLGLAVDPREHVKVGVDRLLAMQTTSGGFSYWPGGTEVHGYASAYATWVLTLAARAGHPVPKAALERALADLERRVAAAKGQGARQDTGGLVRQAIALHVLAESDRYPRDEGEALYLRRAELPAFGRAFLLMAMHRADPQRAEVASLTQELLADVEELPATAHTLERHDWDWGAYFHSDGRSDAILLTALLRARPEHAVIEKLARGLLERRISGAWRNTQENAYALVALAEYARVREADPPDFVGRAWVGSKPVFEASFLGRDLKAQEATARMPELLRPAQAKAPAPLVVTLQRAGQGRMYYRLGAEWAPAEPNPPARAHGLEVTRALRLADGPLAARPATIGDLAAIDVTLTSRTRIRYVALEVPLPAGLEAVQLNLGKGQAAGTLSGARGWWVSHEELRRDRVVVFADDLPPGTHHHTIFVRATSRGVYQLPPAHAEAMYMPEVWGRSEGATMPVR